MVGWFITFPKLAILRLEIRRKAIISMDYMVIYNSLWENKWFLLDILFMLI